MAELSHLRRRMIEDMTVRNLDALCNGSRLVSFLSRRRQRVSRFCSWSPRRAPDFERYEG